MSKIEGKLIKKSIDNKAQESAVEKTIKFAKQGKNIWNEIDNEIKKKFKKYFHIRPSSTGFTIVSTHPNKSMNGIQSISKSNLSQGINNISNSIKNESIEWKNANIVKQTGTIEKFKTTYRKEEEYKVQAKFINKILEGSKEIKDFFEVKELYFIGSEIILHDISEKDLKIDILAYGKTFDGNTKIFFIEVKKAGNVERDRKEKAFEQVQSYVDVYSKSKDFAELIKFYPMLDEEIDVTKCKCEGWVVKGNTTERKMQKKDKNYIEIFQEGVN